jgi:hypothetical protein
MERKAVAVSENIYIIDFFPELDATLFSYGDNVSLFKHDPAMRKKRRRVLTKKAQLDRGRW